jgi:uncharacterized protein YndB with AHSA1/START domain
MNQNTITIETVVHVPLDQAWKVWTEPKHITGWAFASDDWEAPEAENDLRVGGKSKIVMAAKDKSVSFDLIGTYTKVEENHLMEYYLEDDRKVSVLFEEVPDGVHITETFEPESENTTERQREGWNAILENYKKYAESISLT